MTGKKGTTIQNSNNKTHIHPKAKSNAFIKEYASVSHKNPSKPQRKKWNYKITPSSATTYETPFTIKELHHAISKLPDHSSPGPDNIPNAALKKLPQTTKNYLLNTINSLWKKGQHPNTCKNATIIPILKPDKPAATTSSYRPIALTNGISKIYERMIKSRLQHYLETNNLLNSNQSGFRENRSTEDQLLYLAQ
ncbi:MAG: hypothetical protein GY928_03010 [Colwellia sp.]|nr:hypothetical protein [Colwellia sp.]